MMDANSVAAEIIALYVKFGHEDYIGEPVSQVEHMSQCAELALKQGYDDEVVLAAFFHDIGHLLEHVTEVKYMDAYGIADHEKIGAEYLLRKGFSEKIARLVNSHVAAKRYLTYANPGYYKQLSEASKKTLEFQGGVMSNEEAMAFENDDYFHLYIRLRRWDEAAKREGVPVINLLVIKDLIIKHLKKQERNPS